MLISLKQVSAFYTNSCAVLNHIDLDIRENEFVGITGKTGSGKTTLLETIGGLHQPDHGQVLFHDRDIYSRNFDINSFRRSLQIVFQFPENQFFETDVLSETAFGPKMLGMTPEETEELVRIALFETGMDEDIYKNKSPFILSGGQKRRLALACALAVSPGILLLDEPFSGLDPDGQELIIKTLHTLRKNGITILMVSHDPNVLYELSDRIIVMSDGKIVMDGKPYEVYSDAEFCSRYGIGQPQTKRAADFLGIEPGNDYSYANFLSCVRHKIMEAAL